MTSPPPSASAPIVSTKFTWPRDPKPKDSFLLTPEREALWRKWIALYNELMLPRGHLSRRLYDIGFDKPEAHVVEKDGRLYYAFYAPSLARPRDAARSRGGRVPRARLLQRARTRRGRRRGNRLDVAFERFLLLEAMPV